MSKSIVWVHGDCLNPQQKALQKFPDVPAIFVWDEQLLRRRNISLKRIVFIYECLLELPVVIRKGNVVAELLAFAEENGADQIVTTHSVSPGFSGIARQLAQAKLRVVVCVEDAFVEMPASPDLKRFSHYWRQAQRHL
jgi:hypothetical protein